MQSCEDCSARREEQLVPMARYRDRVCVLKPTQLTLGGGRALALQAVQCINQSYTKKGLLRRPATRCQAPGHQPPCGEPGPF